MPNVKVYPGDTPELRQRRSNFYKRLELVRRCLYLLIGLIGLISFTIWLLAGRS